jgi:hypothetical protein
MSRIIVRSTHVWRTWQSTVNSPLTSQLLGHCLACYFNTGLAGCVGSHICSSSNCSTECSNVPEYTTSCHQMLPEPHPFLRHQPLLDITMGRGWEKLADVIRTLLEASNAMSDATQGQLCHCSRGGGGLQQHVVSVQNMAVCVFYSRAVILYSDHQVCCYAPGSSGSLSTNWAIANAV